MLELGGHNFVVFSTVLITDVYGHHGHSFLLLFFLYRIPAQTVELLSITTHYK